ETLQADGIDIAPYGQVNAALSNLPAHAGLLLDPRRVTLGLWQSVPKTAQVIEAFNPTIQAKSRKNEADIAHVRVTMEHDGAALCEFFAWLEQALADPAQQVTELTVDERLTEARARRPGFVSPSFDTIAGFNANGAMPHYRATSKEHATLEGNGLLLIDSGGQYLGGTTDITRVVPVGQPTSEQKRDFTLVLKCLIALSSARFPRGIRAPMLDAVARTPLWAHCLDYGHGTGHGVGYFLCVHEGPQSISCHAPADPKSAMEAGMITSAEPGLYRDGQWGIRIENLVLNRPAARNEFGEFLHFETLTLCPIDTRCVDRTLLNGDEIAWLNGYHAIVRERLLPHVAGAARDWLTARTEKI
ncbi:MAG: aminopeptidase family protein P, partial [Burkholderiaceae bacterium]|nr:aminopeptidase family protein P [Burkholderiaceae bacterium]